MSHRTDMLARLEAEAASLLDRQLTDGRHPLCGAFIQPAGHTDTRQSGFACAALAKAWLIPGNRYFHSEDVRRALELGLDFLLHHLRPDGCMDLSSCNFASAPDTAFTVNALLNAWWLAEKDSEAGWLKELLLPLMTRCGEGIAHGGFHTPNHRWAIAACLKHLAGIAGREDFSRRADVYLGEGLDVDAFGEFAERSAGGYNQVNDDQMIRLFMATGERRYLEAAAANLRMMLTYMEPDGSIFTGNSTRQDYGTKVWPASYYILYLLTGYLLRDEELASWSSWCWEQAAAHGVTLVGIEWLALWPDLEEYGLRRAPDLSRVTRYEALYPASRIARLREGPFSCTVMAGRPDFLHIRSGEGGLRAALYGNVCEKRNFVADEILRTESETHTFFRDHQSAARRRADSWYYLPFDGDGPATADWWQMDNANTRRRLIEDALDITVDIALRDGGVDVGIRAEGLSGVPLRLELGYEPGAVLRGGQFITPGTPGQWLTLAGGPLEACWPGGDILTLDRGFAEHGVTRRMGGAYPLSEERFTVFLTAYTPCERSFRISRERLLPLTL